VTKPTRLRAIRSARCHKKGRDGRRRRLEGDRERSTMAKEKPPIFGMIQRSGQVVLWVLSNVKQALIGPIIKSTIAKGITVYTDEYDITAK